MPSSHQLLDQLGQALDKESDPGVCADIVAILRNLKSKPWATQRTVRLARFLIEAAQQDAGDPAKGGEQEKPVGNQLPAEAADQHIETSIDDKPGADSPAVSEERSAGRERDVNEKKSTGWAPRSTRPAPIWPGATHPLPPHAPPLWQPPPAPPLWQPMPSPDSAGPRPVVEENVQFTVYRPRAVRPDLWYPMLAFAHLAERRPDSPADEPDPIEQVKALAEQALGDQAAAYASPTSDARGGIPKESELTFVPSMEGVEFNPPRCVFRWLEDVHKEEFRLRAGVRFNGQVVRGRLTVFLGVFILADVDLMIRVDENAPQPPAPALRPLAVAAATSSGSRVPLEVANARPYRKVFPSYSHRDTAIVEQAERLGAAMVDTYLRDRTTLRSGEQWSPRLLELIDEADVFQLFWSTNSMRSEYVRQEWEHAVTLARPNFIRPTYWENPLPHSEDPCCRRNP